MDKKTIYYIVEWVVALAACAWLAWKMVTYDNYAALWETIRTMDASRVCALLICIALMPVNMSIEAWRWRTLIKGDRLLVIGDSLSWYEAHRQVYYSKLAGLITPWRLGEYPARGVLMNERVKELKNEGDVWKKVLSMGAVGSATMTMAIIAAGMAAMILEIGNWRLEIGFYLLVALLLILALVFAPRLLRRWATVSHRLIFRSLGQSLVRLLCWCVQLGLVLYALGAISNFKFQIFDLPIYYLLVTITPNVPIAEAGVRGVWAITLFGTMNAAFAGVLLWGINTLLPCVGWFFFKKK